MDKFEKLGFLVRFAEGITLTQAAPFFANLDSGMPAAPVSANQILDWLEENIAASLERNAEKVLVKENDMLNSVDLDVTMADACLGHTRAQSNSSPAGTSMPRSPAYLSSATFVEAISKTSVVKQQRDIKGHSIKVRLIIVTSLHVSVLIVIMLKSCYDYVCNT